MASVSDLIFESDSPLLDRAFRIAKGDIAGNIHPYSGGLLDGPRNCLLAGLDYDRPWTRDAAINVWNGLSVVDPQVSRHTLLSVIERRGDELRIGGQYWDAVLWSVGADAYIRATADREFATLATRAIAGSLEHLESTEYDEAFGLFRGPAVYGDGVSAYPNRYARTGGSSSILDWPDHNHDRAAPAGFGIPMMALSTNCAYLRAYEIAAALATRSAAGGRAATELRKRAAKLRAAIRRSFVNGNTLRYLVERDGSCDAQEGMGFALAALFRVLSPEEARCVLGNAVVEKAGIPCVYPSFERYGEEFGRHCGTVWPHIQALYAEACAENELREHWENELFSLASHVVRDGQFVEIYHPHTGDAYGGRQERNGDVSFQWKSCERQTWSATGYLRMVFRCILGMKLSQRGVTFSPRLPTGVSWVHVGGLVVRGRPLEVELQRQPGTNDATVRFSNMKG